MQNELKDLRGQYKFISQNEFELGVRLFFGKKDRENLQESLFDNNFEHYYICENLESYILRGKIVKDFQKALGKKKFLFPPKFFNRAPYFGVKFQLDESNKEIISHVCNGIENSYSSRELLIHLNPLEIISLFAMIGKWKQDTSHLNVCESLNNIKSSEVICELIHAGYNNGLKDMYNFSLISEKKAKTPYLADRIETVTHNLMPFLAIQEFKESLKQERFKDYSSLGKEKQLTNIYTKLKKLDMTSY